MAKFKPGEFALIIKMKLKKKNAPLLKYENTICEVVTFLGNVDDKEAGFRNDGDWYEVETEDGTLLYVREGVLQKLPNEYSPGDMAEIRKIYQPPPVRKKAAKVSQR